MALFLLISNILFMHQLNGSLKNVVVHCVATLSSLWYIQKCNKGDITKCDFRFRLRPTVRVDLLKQTKKNN